jgi:trimethylguanosine synthase
MRHCRAQDDAKTATCTIHIFILDRKRTHGLEISRVERVQEMSFDGESISVTPTPWQSKGESLCPFGPTLQKYWDRRYDLFARFDEGIAIDEEGLFSVKPEQAALRIAERVRGETVLDAFCGIGGSAIAFARSGKRVIAIEADEGRLDMARANARLYGVEDRIRFVHGDFPSAMEGMSFDSIYLDPAWGGPEYARLERFPLRGFVPPGEEILRMSFARTNYVAFTLPLNFDLTELALLRRDFSCLFESMWGRPIFYTVFFEDRVRS